MFFHPNIESNDNLLTKYDTQPIKCFIIPNQIDMLHNYLKITCNMRQTTLNSVNFVCYTTPKTCKKSEIYGTKTTLHFSINNTY